MPFIGGILPVIALSVIGRYVASDADWVALSVGLSVGGIAGAVALVGWNVLGTPLVALAPDAETRRSLYGRSFYIRLLATVLAGVIAAHHALFTRIVNLLPAPIGLGPAL